MYNYIYTYILQYEVKKNFLFKNYLYLFLLEIVIFFPDFSCNKDKEIIETELEPLMKFVNNSDYDLRELRMNSAVKISNLM